MNIYFPHSKQLDYNKFYAALRSSKILAKHTLVLPYETSATPENSKEVIRNADLLIAEVSYPGTGLGIELGWAEALKKRVICIYKYDFHIAGSLKYVSTEFISYDSYRDLLKKLEKVV